MKVALINTDMVDLTSIFKTRTVKKLPPQVPLGICYIGAALENNGIEVAIYDNYLDELSNDELAQKILRFRPDLVGFTTTCVNIENAYQVALAIKGENHQITIVFGGPQASIRPFEVMRHNCIDYLIAGEGEETFLRLIRHLEGDNNGLNRIGGIFYCSGQEGIRFTGKQVLIQDLDSLPFPARHLIKLQKYDNTGHGCTSASSTFTLSSSRGCPYSCSFCSSSSYWGRKYRARGAKNIVDEIEHLINDYAACGIYFREDNFMVNRDRVMSICDEILERRVKIDWICESRIDNVTEELLEKMSEAGCRGVWCGVESGSQKILDFIRKGYTVEQIRTAFRWFKKYGIKAGAGFMIGFPGETMKDIRKTLDLAKEIEPTWAYFQTYVGYPGSELHDYIVKNKLYAREWNGIYDVKPDRLPKEVLPKIEVWLKGEFERYKNSQLPRKKKFLVWIKNILVFFTAKVPGVRKFLRRLRDKYLPCLRI